MYILIMIRYDKGKMTVYPFMEDEDEDNMKIFTTLQEVREVSNNHILAKSSENIVVDLELAHAEFV